MCVCSGNYRVVHDIPVVAIKSPEVAAEEAFMKHKATAANQKQLVLCCPVLCCCCAVLLCCCFALLVMYVS